MGWLVLITALKKSPAFAAVKLTFENTWHVLTLLELKHDYERIHGQLKHLHYLTSLTSYNRQKNLHKE